MNLEETIAHAEDVAETVSCKECAEDHRQLAGWLKELKAYKENACDDAISRRAVLDLVADYDLSMGQVVKGIHALPSVTPQPKMGHWLDRSRDGYSQYICSCCYAENIDRSKYCPNCGRKMEEL